LSYDAGSDLHYFAASPFSEYLVGGYQGLLFVFRLNSTRDGFEELCSKQIFDPPAWRFGGIAFVSRTKLYVTPIPTDLNRFFYLQI
jgi:hypothetical protein